MKKKLLKRGNYATRKDYPTNPFPEIHCYINRWQCKFQQKERMKSPDNTSQ